MQLQLNLRELKIWRSHNYLLQMEKNAAAGRTPSSVPLSTPPPASLGVSSPKLAPLSPVHTNSLNDSKSLNTRVEPTNFTLPPSFSDDERIVNTTARGPSFDYQQPLGDQRSATGGNLFVCLFFPNFMKCFHFPFGK